MSIGWSELIGIFESVDIGSAGAGASEFGSDTLLSERIMLLPWAALFCGASDARGGGDTEEDEEVSEVEEISAAGIKLMAFGIMGSTISMSAIEHRELGFKIEAGSHFT